jgi:hypothetical protein
MDEKTHDSNCRIDDRDDWICNCGRGVIFEKGLNDSEKFRENQPADALDFKLECVAKCCMRQTMCQAMDLTRC